MDRFNLPLLKCLTLRVMQLQTLGTHRGIKKVSGRDRIGAHQFALMTRARPTQIKAQSVALTLH